MRLKALRNHVELEQNSPNVHTIRFQNVRAGWEQWILLTSDRHHDSVDTDTDLERKHLELALDRDALIFDAGDLNDVMQGPGDKRGAKDKLKGTLQTQGYFNEVVNDAYKFYHPYADRFVMMGLGNHETAVMKYFNINLTQSITERLRDNGGITLMGGYGGWVRFMFHIQKTVQTSKRMKYYHGTGVSPLMSFGTLHIRRQASYLPDADIVWNGHTHDAFVIPVQRERVSDAGTPYQDTVWYLRSPSYKDEYKDGSGGFAVERIGGPKPIGCVWGRFFFDGGAINSEFYLMLK